MVSRNGMLYLKASNPTWNLNEIGQNLTDKSLRTWAEKAIFRTHPSIKPPTTHSTSQSISEMQTKPFLHYVIQNRSKYFLYFLFFIISAKSNSDRIFYTLGIFYMCAVTIYLLRVLIPSKKAFFCVYYPRY